VADIHSEADARRIVHTLGTTQLRGPYSWDIVDSQGRLFVAEIRYRSGGRPMVVGRNLRTAATGDTDAISTEAIGAMGAANFHGTPAAPTNAHDRNLLEASEVRK